MSKIYDLLRRYRDDELRGEAKEAFDGWFDSYESSDVSGRPHPDAGEVEELEAIRSEENMLKLKAQLDARINGVKPAGTSWGIWLSIAASVVFLSLLAYVGWDLLHQPMHKVVAGATSIDVPMPDGSHVRLAAGSTLQFPEEFSTDERLVTLEGDAFFDVAKDKSRPFRITCGDLETQVLGTSFGIVSEASGDVTVAVVSGRVALLSGRAHIVLGPRERGVFHDAENTIIKSSVDTAEWNTLVDTHYNSNFRNAKFSDVLHTLEVRFGVTFTLQNRDIGNCMFTADLSGQSLETALRLASQSLVLTYTMKGDVVDISGKGCRESRP